jgi:hypothetical protein
MNKPYFNNDDWVKILLRCLGFPAVESDTLGFPLNTVLAQIRAYLEKQSSSPAVAVSRRRYRGNGKKYQNRLSDWWGMQK